MLGMQRPRPDEAGANYEAFVRMHTRHLLALGYLLRRDWQAAQDLVQETLLQSYRQWPKVRGATSQGAYARKILVNIHLAEQRKKRVLESLSLQQTGVTPTTLASDANIPEQDAVLRAIESLTLREQTVVVLRYYEDLDTPAIASAMDCRPGTVRSLLHRALTKLRNSSHLAPDETSMRS